MDEQEVFHRCRFNVSRTIGSNLWLSKLLEEGDYIKMGCNWPWMI